MTRTLNVEGSLDVAGPGDGFTLHANGPVLRCDVRSVRTALALFRLSRTNAASVRGFASWLDRTGLRLSVRYRNFTVVEVGAGVAPTWVARWLGLATSQRQG